MVMPVFPPVHDLTKGFAQEGVVDTITVGDGPSKMAYNPGNGYLYVINSDSNSVSVIDQNNDVVNTIPVDANAIAYHPGNGNIYVSNGVSDTVSIIGSIIPLANAGPDQTVDSGSTVQLAGNDSSDPRNETLTYQWTQIAGPEVTISAPTSVKVQIH